MKREYTFENFVITPSNQFAYNIVKTVAENTGGIHNPLFIYGELGVGKTHLIKAIENEIKITKPDLKVLYATAEAFCNDMLEALENRNMRAFHLKYRTADILLFDDFQFASGKYMLQEELFYTLEMLLNNGGQIVISSDKHLKDIDMVTDRLKNRILSGLIIDVQQPDIDTRIEIIKNKFKQYEMGISYDIIEFIAEKLEDNLFKLEGVVKKIYALYTVNFEKTTVILAKKIINEIGDL